MKIITFDRPDGKGINGYYAEPASGSNAPGVVVIQEWWGLNDQIRGIANQIAGAGYRALVPDLYRGKVAVEAQEAQHLMGSMNFGDVAAQDIRGAVQYLRKESPKVGVAGFCLGGALTLLAAVNVPEADAASSWYGFPPLEYIDAAKIKMPLQGHFANDDAYFPVTGLDALEKKLKAGGVKFEFYRYDAEHAFANEAGPHYNKEAAEMAWGRMLEFFGKTLN
jgi:carboxymethylenebutenolidase